MSDKQIAQIAFLKTWQNVQRRVKTRPQARHWNDQDSGFADYFRYCRKRGRPKMSTKEYKCILHYEADRVEKPYATMAEAIFAMQNALVSKEKIVFAEVICVSVERVAYQSRLK